MSETSGFIEYVAYEKIVESLKKSRAEQDGLRAAVGHLTNYDFDRAVAAVRGISDEELVRTLCVEIANTINTWTATQDRLERLLEEAGIDPEL